MSTKYPSDLTDAEWECAQRCLPPSSRRGRPRIHSLRSIQDAVFYVLRTGCAWRYLPSNFSPWQTVFYHFRRFRLNGAWHLLYTTLHRAERERIGRDAEPSAALMDSQSVKTVEESGRIRGYDAHKCVEGRKRHLLVDTLGLPLSVYVTPADVHDTQGARRSRPWACSASSSSSAHSSVGRSSSRSAGGGHGKGKGRGRQRRPR
jgi:putative transposase